MNLIVYADFNRPMCCLASQRVDRLLARGLDVQWRAVEHDRRLSMMGTPSAALHAAENLDAARLLLMPGDWLPVTAPDQVSNTRAAVAGYAEAVSDGLQNEMRRSIFDAIWVHGRHLSDAYEVRRLIADLMWPPVPSMLYRLCDLPTPLARETDLTRAMRRSGGTVIPGGGPLTTIAWRRIRAWREEWRQLPTRELPTLVGPDGRVSQGIAALDALAALDTGAPGTLTAAAGLDASAYGAQQPARQRPGPMPDAISAALTTSAPMGRRVSRW
ncbi:hypothetical protein DN069_22790 [Streptacidiphilus pinicola]|uniref:DSBA-like thioredoxin domain-containing protein n=1 Tax=Streptacidiphilus pinicola TaxID=2219663 RepID=A0A2X0J7C6_9ACTN|nr:hypothetical protein [Streptacidiphilus pinicola]RAG83348.1 hypothetical protein DN069_22790 [Streptacidiphilus pinicola]